MQPWNPAIRNEFVLFCFLKFLFLFIFVYGMNMCVLLCICVCVCQRSEVSVVMYSLQSHSLSLLDIGSLR